MGVSALGDNGDGKPLSPALETIRARNLDSFNAKMAKAGKPKLPRIVIPIDELVT